MKKNIITSIILSGAFIASAADYMIVVDKAHNKYNILETSIWVETDSEYTEWSNTGNVLNCGTWNPVISQQTESFNQSATCDIEQERSELIREINTVDSSTRVVGEIDETQSIQGTSFRDVVVGNNIPVIEQSNYNCSQWTPDTNTVANGESFTQTRECDVDMMEEWTYSVDSIQIGNWENRYTVDSPTESQNAIGTLVSPAIFSSCYNTLMNGQSIGDGIYTINNGGEDIDVYCNMSQGGWTLVFNHNAAGGYFNPISTALNINEGSPSLATNKYSILNRLEGFRKDGRFEFKIGWLGFPQENHWYQQSNPTYQPLFGYQPISIPLFTEGWQGLEFNGITALMDGSVGSSSWFYAIGLREQWNGGIPASLLIANYGLSNVNLWIK